LVTREYGSTGPTVILVHGGPGMAGYLAPVGRALAHDFRVLEPFQRRFGAARLTVAQHVADLHELVSEHERPALLGSSWGAMLALAYAAEHPEAVAGLVLVGCGTFDPEARAVFLRALEERTEHLRGRFAELRRTIPDPDRRYVLTGELMLPAYSHELASTELELASADARGFDETWADMLRCQEEGQFPQTFSNIDSPVLMIHGEADPHPGAMTRDTLRAVMPQLEYVELDRCGHYPWLERHARAQFFSILREWLERHG
jgi:pimeloyl-ACP methyl ester carboxylesterase